jgi:hypothetical protein
MSEPIALPAPNAPPKTADAARLTAGAPARVRTRTVTPRALLIGLVMTVVVVAMTQVLGIRHSAADVAGGAPPAAPTYFLFLYVLLVAPLLRRLGAHLALSQGEMLLIYMMMIVAGPITHSFGIGFLVPHMVAPTYYGAEEPRWQEFLPHLPAWLGPRDPAVVLGFFRGTHGVVPWAAWLVPMLAWSSLLLVLFFVMLCINAIMRRQWIDHERLVFPLTAIPLALTEAPAAWSGSACSGSASRCPC